ncbi:uncharacterized protein LOC122064097 isoform X2 [Macadamia integrifolia]|uniref:uncharacterized protein LOC122064097 isoform X2 n=1 Tax=Macadamia integrifolia TaxID=60698 RepID=UPI001C4FF503|nr:uncharacterized protein LOC122064097 isoform X2 [Macadamia integrifolia]
MKVQTSQTMVRTMLSDHYQVALREGPVSQVVDHFLCVPECSLKLFPRFWVVSILEMYLALQHSIWNGFIKRPFKFSKKWHSSFLADNLYSDAVPSRFCQVQETVVKPRH